MTSPVAAIAEHGPVAPGAAPADSCSGSDAGMAPAETQKRQVDPLREEPAEKKRKLAQVRPTRLVVAAAFCGTQ